MASGQANAAFPNKGPSYPTEAPGSYPTETPHSYQSNTNTGQQFPYNQEIPQGQTNTGANNTYNQNQAYNPPNSYNPTQNYNTNQPQTYPNMKNEAIGHKVQNYPEAKGQPVQPKKKLAVDWILFIVGFFMPIVWIVAGFLPLCRKPKWESRNAYWGWVACLIGLSCYIIVIVIVIPFYATRVCYYTGYSTYTTDYYICNH